MIFSGGYVFNRVYLKLEPVKFLLKLAKLLVFLETGMSHEGGSGSRDCVAQQFLILIKNLNV